jgi:hypothetical protein
MSNLPARSHATVPSESKADFGSEPEESNAMKGYLRVETVSEVDGDAMDTLSRQRLKPRSPKLILFRHQLVLLQRAPMSAEAPSVAHSILRRAALE